MMDLACVQLPQRVGGPDSLTRYGTLPLLGILHLAPIPSLPPVSACGQLAALLALCFKTNRPTS